jgi:hypothetical protein
MNFRAVMTAMAEGSAAVMFAIKRASPIQMADHFCLSSIQCYLIIEQKIYMSNLNLLPDVFKLRVKLLRFKQKFSLISTM